MEKQIFSDFIDKYRDAEMVVIGIGEEWNAYLEKQEYQDLHVGCDKFFCTFEMAYTKETCE